MSEIFIIKDTGKGVINKLPPEKVVPIKTTEGTTGDFMTLDSENEIIDNWSISNSGNFNITPKLLSLSDYGNTYNTISLDTASQFPRLNIEDAYAGSSLSISSRPEFLFEYQNNTEGKYVTFSTKSIFLQDVSDSLELTPQYFRVGTSNLFANINFPLIGNYNYNLPLVNEDNEPEFNHTLVASINGQFADEYGNIEIEGGTAGGDLTLEQARSNGNILEGDVEVTDNVKIHINNNYRLTFSNKDGLYIQNNNGASVGVGGGGNGIFHKSALNPTLRAGIEVSGTTDTGNTIMVIDANIQSKGLMGSKEFNKQEERRAFAQLSDVYDYYQQISGYDAGATQTLKNIAGVLTWVTD